MGKEMKYGAFCGAGAGLLFFAVRRVLIHNGWLAFGACLLLLLAGLFLLDRSLKGKPRASAAEKEERAPAGDAQPIEPLAAAAQEKARASLQRIKTSITAIRDPAVQKEAEDCSRLCEAILQAAVENGDQGNRLNNFFNHYLPMFDQTMANYVKCEAAQVLPEAQVQELKKFLDVMELAMVKLKETVYTSDMDCLALNMDVLKTLYQQDGLLNDGLSVPQERGGLS